MTIYLIIESRLSLADSVWKHSNYSIGCLQSNTWIKIIAVLSNPPSRIVTLLLIELDLQIKELKCCGTVAWIKMFRFFQQYLMVRYYHIMTFKSNWLKDQTWFFFKLFYTLVKKTVFFVITCIHHRELKLNRYEKTRKIMAWKSVFL